MQILSARFNKYIDLFWKISDKLVLTLLLFQLVYFLILNFSELQDRKAELASLLWKAVLFLVFITVLVIVYKGYLQQRPLIKRVVTRAYKLFIVAYLLQWFFVLLYGLINPPLTFTQIGSLISGNGLKRDYVSYRAMSPNIKLAVLASEDQLFPDHDGFDIKAIKLALKYNKKRPNKTKGASTISQQTAKNCFLWQQRNFIRKGLEVYFTFMIETFWSKKKILNRYLNVIEMGKGVFGIESAARFYFNKPAKDLTRMESAMLAACLPNPKKYTVKPMSAYVRSRYDDILVQMNNIEPDPDIQALIKSTTP